MSEGFFIGLGDKTSCGGEVLDGDPQINLYGLLHACEGDRVSCGVNGKTYRIVGGISHMESHGRRMAGTLDSRSNCRSATDAAAVQLHPIEPTSRRTRHRIRRRRTRLLHRPQKHHPRSTRSHPVPHPRPGGNAQIPGAESPSWGGEGGIDDCVE